MGHSVKPELKNITERLLSLSPQFEQLRGSAVERESPVLAQFQAIQEIITESVRKLAPPIEAPLTPPKPKIVATLAAPTPRRVQDASAYQSSNHAFQPALQDVDVIEALLDLHDKAQNERQVARKSAAVAASAVRGESPALEPTKVPRITAQAQAMEFSRSHQPRGAAFSAILKPKRPTPPNDPSKDS